MLYIVQIQDTATGMWTDNNVYDSPEQAMEELKLYCVPSRNRYRIVQVVAEAAVTIADYREHNNG